jgi:hypothetical protein
VEGDQPRLCILRLLECELSENMRLIMDVKEKGLLCKSNFHDLWPSNDDASLKGATNTGFLRM